MLPVAFTGSVNVTLRFESTGTSIAPLVGVVDCTAGGASPAETTMSSTPTHSSLPTALDVMMRICTSGWLPAFAGNAALTAVTSVATPAQSSRRRRSRRERS